MLTGKAGVDLVFIGYCKSVTILPTPEGFIGAFKDSKIGIDIRMHLRPNKTVRNHGTGIRILEKDVPVLFGKRRKLI